MTTPVLIASGSVSPSLARRSAWSPGLARAALLLIVAAAIAAALLAAGGETSVRAVQNAGADLTRLLRAMAMLKALMAACAIAAVVWRLGVAATPVWFTAYAAASAAMGAGPGLIWGMDHVGAGALLLHGGLLAGVLLLWRDPEVERRLAAMVAARRLSVPSAAPAGRVAARSRSARPGSPDPAPAADGAALRSR